MKNSRIVSNILVALLAAVVSVNTSAWAQKGKAKPTCPVPVAVLAGPTACTDGSGCLDTSFGHGGITNTGGSASSLYSSGKAVAIQSDGRILVAGSSLDSTGETDPVVVRYNNDGTLDSGFGSSGVVKLNGLTDARGIALQPGGKILVVGSAFWIVRLEPNGGLDTTFGIGGKKQVTFVNQDVSFVDVAIQADGKIVAAGDGYGAGSGRKGATTIWKIARLTPDGDLDSSFGSGGILEKTDGNRVGGVVIQRVKVGTTDQDRILVGGSSGGNFLLMRLNANGSPDTTFGAAGTGKVLTDICGANDWLEGLTLDTSNNIIAAGSTSWGGGYSFALTRYSPGGILDPSFGGEGSGKVITNIFAGDGTWDMGKGVAVQTDGKLVVSGWASVTSLSGGYFALARYNSDGTLDPLFGVNGVVAVYIGGNATRIAIQAWDQKIVQVGSPDYSVVRYLP